MAARSMGAKEEAMSKALGFSLIAHGLIVALFTVKAFLMPEEALDYQSAIRVDIVGLPEKYDPNKVLPPEPTSKVEEKQKEQTKEEAPPPKKIEDVKEPVKNQPVPVAKPTKNADADAINLNKTKAKQADALKKLKAMSALEEIANEVGKGEKKKNQESSSKLIRGNVIASGSDLTGLSKLQHDSYIGVIDRHVKKFWAIPQWLANKNLKAQARIKIDDEGNIIEKTIAKSSGNSSYDDAVLETIEEASPFPKPPDKFARLVNIEGILLGFPE
jgi:colicin import membrane protein